MPSRAAAVRDLLRLGLASVGLKPVASGAKSSSFGVLDANGQKSRPKGKGQDPG
jgi:hypothetical protein